MIYFFGNYQQGVSHKGIETISWLAESGIDFNRVNYI